LKTPDRLSISAPAGPAPLIFNAMNALTRSLSAYWSSSIGKKFVVAFTGLILVVFLAGHLIGNMAVFAGREAFNEYAYFLHHMLHGAGIWVFRIVMLAAFVTHIVATISLTRQNRAARLAYQKEATVQASKSSRTMLLTGLTILAFVIYHLLHFTARVGNSYNSYVDSDHLAATGLTRQDAWKMVIDGFNWWPATLFYVIAMSLLAPHIMHGVGSVFQTLGLRSKKSAGLIKQVSIGYSLFIWAGFISIPVAILIFGYGR
jgi:succinate dehydrogenase / fumarate reductase, cytochrome b subunit